MSKRKEKKQTIENQNYTKAGLMGENDASEKKTGKSVSRTTADLQNLPKTNKSDTGKGDEKKDGLH